MLKQKGGGNKENNKNKTVTNLKYRTPSKIYEVVSSSLSVLRFQRLFE